jgi:hypothetical protein
MGIYASAVMFFAVLVVLLLGYLVYASAVVFEADDKFIKALAYATALLDAWLLGALYAAVASDCGECAGKHGQ